MVCVTVTVEEAVEQPNIVVADLEVYVGGKKVTSWSEDDDFYVHVYLENMGGTGEATVRIYYGNTVIEEFNTVVYSGVPQRAIRHFAAGTIPPGTHSLCAEVVSQEPWQPSW